MRDICFIWIGFSFISAVFWTLVFPWHAVTDNKVMPTRTSLEVGNLSNIRKMLAKDKINQKKLRRRSSVIEIAQNNGSFFEKKISQFARIKENLKYMKSPAVFDLDFKIEI